ncbi:hypothetical protein GBAR_LOCUS16920 [Geodia barretti]|uniref:Uncharacterized protein n=1 Tax=Geodia barretti TaxID=519541 RepID=A0AA35WR79_GEOBA|nr:hypothetical protein GBAR_LOCUS16920 [Geodia barretti]
MPTRRCFSRQQKSYIHPYIFLYSHNLYCDNYVVNNVSYILYDK